MNKRKYKASGYFKCHITPSIGFKLVCSQNGCHRPWNPNNYTTYCMQSTFVWPDFHCHNVTPHVSLTSKLVSLQGTPFRELFCTALCLSPTLISLSHTQTCSHKKQKIYLFQSILALKDRPSLYQSQGFVKKTRVVGNKCHSIHELHLHQQQKVKNKYSSHPLPLPFLFPPLSSTLWGHCAFVISHVTHNYITTLAAPTSLVDLHFYFVIAWTACLTDFFFF